MTKTKIAAVASLDMTVLSTRDIGLYSSGRTASKLELGVNFPAALLMQSKRQGLKQGDRINNGLRVLPFNLNRGVFGHPLDIYPGIFRGDIKHKGLSAIIYGSVLYLCANPFMDDGVAVRK